MSAEFFLAVAGAVLVLEGVPWFLYPAGMKKTLRDLLALSDGTLRLAGAGTMLLGLLTVWLGNR